MALKKNIRTKLADDIHKRLTPAQVIGGAATIHPYLADTLVMNSIIGHNDDAAKAAAEAKRARKAARNLRNQS